jgi:ATP-dependent Clp protease adaptor protein ClpS
MSNVVTQMPGTGTATKEKVKKEIVFPKFYAVVFHNDNYTPMEFVIQVLVELFNKSIEEAQALTMHIHHNGRGVAGLYTYEIANQKCMETQKVAQVYQHPLRVTVEEA